MKAGGRGRHSILDRGRAVAVIDALNKERVLKVASRSYHSTNVHDANGGQSTDITALIVPN